MRALLSTTDKTGLAEFACELHRLGYELVSTGGTAKALRNAGLPVIEVSEVTSFPEMLDGRVKTLHPLVHGGLLGDTRLDTHRAQMDEAGIQPIEIVCVNLYAFERTVTGVHTLDEAIESIDIGGPAMIRAAAKNHANVAVVVDPADYGAVVAAAHDGSLAEMRPRLAAKAFRHTAYYDSLVARYLSRETGSGPLTETLTVGLKRVLSLRYGENPHQEAAVYQDPLSPDGIASARQLWGKELSYNNFLDADAAWELVADLKPGSCAVIKHGNPCGAASLGSCADSYDAARTADPVSAFGGIAAFHGPVGLEAAERMTAKGNFLEVVVAPEFSADAVALFQGRSGWGQDVRLLEAPLPPASPSLTLRSIRGGVLVQQSDEDPGTTFRVVTDRQPTAAELEAMHMAWRIVPHVKSNAIVIATADRLRGVGAGQMNRVQSVRLALQQAGGDLGGSALASDAFFPFPDSIEVAAQAGVRAVVQPGGSKKDPEVVARANELGVAMAFTGMRHFRH